MTSRAFKLAIVVCLVFFLLPGRSFHTQAGTASPGENIWPYWATETVNQFGGTSKAVAVKGNYAYIGMGPSLVVLDISDPAHPIRQYTSEFLDTQINTLVIQGNYLYSLEGAVYQQGQYFGGGLQIYDISTPASPRKLGFVGTFGWVNDLDVEGDFAYIGGNDFCIYNISDPNHPSFAGKHNPANWSYDFVNIEVIGEYGYLAGKSDGLMVVYLNPIYNPPQVENIPAVASVVSIATTGEYLYAGDGSSMRIFNVSNPGHLVEKSPLDLGGAELSSIYTSGNYLYALTWKDTGTLPLTPYLTIFDISNPELPQAKDSISIYSNIQQFASIVLAEKTYLLAADSVTGLLVMDVSNPDDAAFLGSYSELGLVLDIEYDGTYAYISGDTFRVLDVSNPISPRVTGLLKEDGSVKWVQGKYAYLIYSGWNSGELRLIDVSQPNAPLGISTYAFDGRISDVAVYGPDVYGRTYAYVAGDGLHIIDVTDPENPTLAGELENLVANQLDVLGPNSSGKLFIYLAAGDALTIVDVTDASRPVVSNNYPTELPLVAVDVVQSRETPARLYAYVLTFNELEKFDVTDPAHLSLASSIDLKGDSRELIVAGDYIYTAEYWANLQIYKQTDPATLTREGYYRTPTYTYDIAVIEDLVYLADGEGGLYIAYFGDETYTYLPVEGGSLSSSFDTMTYLFASDTFTTTAQIHHQPRWPGNLPGAITLGGIIRAFDNYSYAENGYPKIDPQKDYSLTVDLADFNLSSYSANDLSLYFWDGHAWQPEQTGVLDSVNKNYTAHPQRFGSWVLAASKLLPLYLPMTTR